MIRDLYGRFRAEFARSMDAEQGAEPDVREGAGIDQHRPIRPPKRWKRVALLGGAVFVEKEHVGRSLLECPECGALVADRYAQARHRERCLPSVMLRQDDAETAASDLSEPDQGAA